MSRRERGARLEAARAALEQGRPRRALALLPRAAGLERVLRPERDFVEAEAWRCRGFFNRAEASYRKAIARASGDPPLLIEAALGSAAGLRSLGAVSAAARRLALAQFAVRASALAGYLPRLRLEKALVLRAAGDYGRSLIALRSILRGCLLRGAGDEAAFLLWAIGGAERFRGRLRAAEDAFAKSLSYARRAGDRTGEGYACFGLGGVTRVLGRLEDSARHYARAERIFRAGDDLFAQAYACCGLANALRQQGRLRAAEGLYRKSHLLYSRLDDRVDLAYVDWGLGKIRLQRGELKACLPFLNRAAAAFRRYNEARGVVLAELSLAQAHHALGKTSQAESFFARAWRLARKAGLHAHLEVFT